MSSAVNSRAWCVDADVERSAEAYYGRLIDDDRGTVCASSEVIDTAETKRGEYEENEEPADDSHEHDLTGSSNAAPPRHT